MCFSCILFEIKYSATWQFSHFNSGVYSCCVLGLVPGVTCTCIIVLYIFWITSNGNFSIWMFKWIHEPRKLSHFYLWFCWPTLNIFSQYNQNWCSYICILWPLQLLSPPLLMTSTMKQIRPNGRGDWAQFNTHYHLSSLPSPISCSFFSIYCTPQHF